MIKLSKAALAAALLIGASGLAIATPADAKKKEEAPAGPKLSNEVRKPAIEAQTALAAKNWDAAAVAIAAVEAAAVTDEEKYFGQKFRLQYESQRLTETAAGDTKAFLKGEGVLIGPLDALIANPFTPKEEQARFTNLRGQIEFDSGRYREAAAFYVRARDLGHNDPELGLSIAKAKTEGGDVAGGVAELEAQIARDTAAGRKAPESYYRYAISKLNTAKMQAQVINWLQAMVKAYPTSKNWRDVILTYGFEGATSARLDKRQRIDLFRLMRVTNALADQNDYLEYAQSASDVGLPAEARAVLMEGKNAGKIPSTSQPSAMLLKEAQAGVAAEAPLPTLERQSAASKTGDLSAQTGDVHLGLGTYPKAIELYRAALTKGVAKPDEVNTHLGIALAMSGDKTAARDAFAAVKTAPRSEIATLWSTWLDNPVAAPAAAATPAASN